MYRLDLMQDSILDSSLDSTLNSRYDLILDLILQSRLGSILSLRLDSIQNIFVKTLLHLPDSTPSLALRAIMGMQGMQWLIWEQKLLLILAIRRLEEHNLARQIFNQKLTEGLPGLSDEASKICLELRIPDVCREEVSKEDIKEEIEIAKPFSHSRKKVVFQQRMRTVWAGGQEGGRLSDSNLERFLDRNEESYEEDRLRRPY